MSKEDLFSRMDDSELSLDIQRFINEIKAERDALGRYCFMYEKQVEQYKEMANVFENFQKAYPLDIFPEVEDWGAVRDALADKGLILDRVSASCMRHVTKVLTDLIPTNGEQKQ